MAQDACAPRETDKTGNELSDIKFLGDDESAVSVGGLRKGKIQRSEEVKLLLAVIKPSFKFSSFPPHSLESLGCLLSITFPLYSFPLHSLSKFPLHWRTKSLRFQHFCEVYCETNSWIKKKLNCVNLLWTH